MERLTTVNWNPAYGLFELSSLPRANKLVDSAPKYLQSPFKGTTLRRPRLIGSIYSNDSHAEAKVLTLRGADRKVAGYLMRGSAAFSSESGFGDEEWFRNASVMAANWLLQFVDLDRAIFERDEITNIDSLIPDSISILIVDLDRASASKLVECPQLDAQLFSYGFRRTEDLYCKAWEPGVHASKRLDELDKNLLLRPFPQLAPHRQFIEKAYSAYLPDSTLPLVRFFYFYQLIELLMEEIAEEALSSSLNILSRLKAINNSSAFRQEVGNLQRIFKEDDRIRKLFSLPRTPPAEFSLLSETCSRTLQSIGAPSAASPAEGVYQIRNQIFHNYRVAGAAFEQHLPEINALLEVVAAELIDATLIEQRHRAQDADLSATACDVYSSLLLDTSPE